MKCLSKTASLQSKRKAAYISPSSDPANSGSFGALGHFVFSFTFLHYSYTVKQSWTEPVINGTAPAARDSHSCTTVGDNLFVFGGTDGKKPLHDLHILETSSNTWMSPSVRGEGPEARESHGAALVGKRIFIFGGCGRSLNDFDEVYYNDLYVLNTESFVWKRAITSGTPPSARDSHSCLSWKNKIIVIGGEDAQDYYLSDVHILDADTLVWKQLDTSGQLLPPRAGHCSVAFGKKLFVFGGFVDSQNLYDDLHMLDVDTGFWTKLIGEGDGPFARFSAAGDNLDLEKKGVLVFIGGCNKHLEALDDMYYLHTELIGENDLEQCIDRLSPKKQLKLNCQEYLLSPSRDKALLRRIGTNTDLCQPTALTVYGQPSTPNFALHESQPFQVKKAFQAKVTQGFPHGYTIETVIDGKPLCGIIFSNRKRSITEVAGVKLYSNENGKLRWDSSASPCPSVLPTVNLEGKTNDTLISITEIPEENTSVSMEDLLAPNAR